jgi:hypothetical protein
LTRPGERRRRTRPAIIYVTGLTQSSDFPIVNPFQPAFGDYADAFVTKISAEGSRILYSSTMGGAACDIGTPSRWTPSAMPTWAARPGALDTVPAPIRDCLAPQTSQSVNGHNGFILDIA